MRKHLASVFCSVVLLLPLLQTSTPDYKVFITNDKYQADLVVFITNDKYQAKNSEVIWYLSNDRYASNFSMKYTANKYNSDLIVYFIHSKNEAGWRHDHPLKGKLNRK